MLSIGLYVFDLELPYLDFFILFHLFGPINIICCLATIPAFDAITIMLHMFSRMVLLILVDKHIFNT